jgi:coenzyme F420-0:L-glutamate ligase/coenzyme F420-1:gamma-L-glutamate ligase
VEAREIRIIGLTGMPEVREGDDLPRLVLEAAGRQGLAFASGDVLVVTQKVVSKAEGRVVDLDAVEPSAFAREIAAAWDRDARVVEVVLRESCRIVRMDRGVLISETHHGFMCANAGVDASNVERTGLVTLLPADPDASAEGIRLRVSEATGADIAVIISDTFGRPWREGHVNFAIGVAGMEPLADYAGRTDPAGYELRVTKMAVADELAAAAELAMGKLDRVPAAIIRGFEYPRGCGTGRSLLREAERDLFR